jgi:hypothetical protein
MARRESLNGHFFYFGRPLWRAIDGRSGSLNGPSVEAIGESIRVRRCAPRIGLFGEVRIGRIEFGGKSYARGPHSAGVGNEVALMGVVDPGQPD